MLHSPSYREKYKEILKTDFPRVPYPKDQADFLKLAALGAELRAAHLLESPAVSEPRLFKTGYPVHGEHQVEKIRYVQERVYINESQYFEGVPQDVWDFYIGGYQPAQKWLKDRKGRSLSFDDILHYQKIIAALQETIRLMDRIP